VTSLGKSEVSRVILQRTRQKPCLPRVFGVVAVNIDDEQSLINALDVSYTIRVQQMSGNVTLNISDLMQGVQAIFAVANVWEHMFIGKDAVQLRDIEVQQGIKVVTAASKTFSSLKHYVWSSLPVAKTHPGGNSKYLIATPRLR